MRESEYNKILNDYLKKNLKKGYTEDSLKWALIRQGYSRTAVEKAMEQVHRELASEAPIIKEKPTITHEVVAEDEMPAKKGFWARLFGLD